MEIEKLTKEEFEFLKQYEDRLNSAATASYVRAIPSGVVHTMREIYSRLIGQTYSMNENCGGCVLTLCRKLNKPYNEFKETIQRNTIRQVPEETVDPPKTRGRKKQTGDSGGTEEQA